MIACVGKNYGIFANADVEKVSHDQSDHLTPHHVRMSALVKVKGK